LADFNASDRFGSGDDTDQAISKAVAALEKEDNKKQVANKEVIRERVAVFLDKIRFEFGHRFKKSVDGFRFDRKVVWDLSLNRPITANLEGWLPDIMPDIAKWDVIKSPHSDNVVVDTLTPIGELFYPHLVAIPMKQTLWDAITLENMQHIVDERSVGRVQKFQAVGELLERLSRKIRLGKLDDHLIMEHYVPSIGHRESQAVLKFLTLRPRSIFNY
jgi:hypothetical protein